MRLQKRIIGLLFVVVMLMASLFSPSARKVEATEELPVMEVVVYEPACGYTVTTTIDQYMAETDSSPNVTAYIGNHSYSAEAYWTNSAYTYPVGVTSDDFHDGNSVAHTYEANETYYVRIEITPDLEDTMAGESLPEEFDLSVKDSSGNTLSVDSREINETGSGMILHVSGTVADNCEVEEKTYTFEVTPPRCDLKVISTYTGYWPIQKYGPEVSTNFDAGGMQTYWVSSGNGRCIPVGMTEDDMHQGVEKEYKFKAGDVYYVYIFFYDDDDPLPDDPKLEVKDTSGKKLTITYFERDSANHWVELVAKGTVPKNCSVDDGIIREVNLQITPPKCNTEVTAEEFEEVVESKSDKYDWDTQKPYPKVKILDSKAHYELDDGGGDYLPAYYVTKDEFLFVDTYYEGDTFYAEIYLRVKGLGDIIVEPDVPLSENPTRKDAPIRYRFAPLEELEGNINVKNAEVIDFGFDYGDDEEDFGYILWILVKGTVGSCSVNTPIEVPNTGIETAGSDLTSQAFRYMALLGICVLGAVILKKQK